jgi:methanogenic corrinoid protein MtbC1
VDAGRTIGTVADLDIAELQRLAAEDEEARIARERAGVEPGSGPPPASASLDVVGEALATVRGLDPDGLEQLLRREIMNMGGEAFLDRLVTPLLVEIGSSWREGNLRPAHEHVAVAVIKRVLGWMMERARVTQATRVLVTGTLTGEKHEVGALLAGTAAALEGWRVIFLGQDLPPDEVALTVRSVGAHAVGISVVNPTDWEAVAEQVRELLGQLPEGVPLVLGGAAAPDMARSVADVRLRPIRSLDQFRATLRSLS